MKTATLTLNGKTYEVQLTDEQVIEIEEPKKVTGFEMAEEKGRYFFENGYSQEDYALEYHAISDELRYGAANYYTDKKLFEWCLRNDKLNRKMRRWAAEHNTYPIDWEDKFADTCFISYNYERKEVDIIHCVSTARAGVVYFCMREIAEAAITEFGEEIKWLAENRPKWF